MLKRSLSRVQENFLLSLFVYQYDMSVLNPTKINMLKVFAALSDHEAELINDDPQAEDIRNYLKSTPIDFKLLESLGVNVNKLTHLENLYQLFHISYPDLPKSIIRSYIKDFQKESGDVKTVEEFMEKVAASYPALEEILYETFDFGVGKTIYNIQNEIAENRNFAQDSTDFKYSDLHDIVRAKLIGHVLGNLYSKGAPFNKLLGILEMIVEKYRPESIARQLLSCLHSTDKKDVKDSMVTNYIDAEKLKESDVFDIVKNLDEYKELMKTHEGENFEDVDDDFAFSEEESSTSIKPKYNPNIPSKHQVDLGSDSSFPRVNNPNDVDVYALTQSVDPTDPNKNTKMFENSKVPGGEVVDLDVGNEATLVDGSHLQSQELKEEKTAIEPHKIKRAYQQALKLLK